MLARVHAAPDHSARGPETDDGILTFVIPVRHHRGVAEWGSVLTRMQETLLSISAQTSSNWQAVVVANQETPLPILPAGVRLIRVDWPHVPLPDAKTVGQHARDEAVREDKGRRVLAGLLALRPTGHVMVVDYDDFVSNRVAGLVGSAPTSNGWYVDAGYVYDGGPILYKFQTGFSKLCGTSLIVNAALLRTPATEAGADPKWIRRWLGSHVFIEDDLADSGTPLDPLPFPAAVYRVGYRGNTSGTRTIRQVFFRRRLLLTDPVRFVRRLSNLRLRRALRREFFGI